MVSLLPMPSSGPGELRRLRSFVALKTTGLKLFLLMICYHGRDTGHERWEMSCIHGPLRTPSNSWR